MKKKKVLKTHIYSFRFLARIFVLNIPTLFVLSLLLLKKEISFITAAVIFILAAGLVSIITAFVFRELERFITYLRSLALGFEPEEPRFKRGLFSPKRLADSFLTIKNLWSNQALSDASILENLPDPLLMLDHSGTIVFANQMSLDVFGNSILGSSIISVFDEPVLEQAVTQVLEEHSLSEWFELTIEEEELYTFQVRIERLPAEAKNKAIAVVVMHDITQLELFKRQQSDFFANASHELKTPLSVISGLIETLQGPAKNDKVAREKFLAMMAQQTNRMTQLVKDLLVLSKLQKPPEKTQSSVILMNDFLKSLTEDFKVKAQTCQKDIKLVLKHDLPRFIGNRNELYQVFQNLIDNALKYGAPHSSVTIIAQLSNGFPKKSDRHMPDRHQTISISVHNVGNPISPRNIHRLFERFYRVDSLKNKLIEGTGLGLGIAQEIVRRHDGMIDISSSEENGTTFTVYLPLEF